MRKGKIPDLDNDDENEPGYGILHHSEGVDLIPANIELPGLEVSLTNVISRETGKMNLEN